MVFLNQARVSGSPVSLAELEHDVVERVPPLAERHEIVEHLEHDILVGEILSVSGILDPVPGEGLLGIGCLAALDVGKPVVDPRLEEGEVGDGASSGFLLGGTMMGRENPSDAYS